MKTLRDFTSARVALGLAGDSLPIQPLLDFRLAHARARDAVHFPLDSRSLLQDVSERRWSARVLHSTARDRQDYLQRPDRGRILDERSVADVRAATIPCPIAFVIADGLSALAVHRHALPLLEIVLPELSMVPDDTNPIWIARQARVAIGDHVGGLLDAGLSVVLIGERPGLSSPDSLGVYLTWQPRPGRVDAERNCISNIHAQGLSYQNAADKLLFLIDESRRRKLSGVNLKDAAKSIQTGAGRPRNEIQRFFAI